MLNTRPPAHYKPRIIPESHPTTPTPTFINLEHVFTFIWKEV